MKRRRKTVKEKKTKTKVARKRKVTKSIKSKSRPRLIKKDAKKLTAIGKVFTYYPNLGVAAIKLSDKLILGNRILIKGEATNFEQKVESMQIEHKPVKEAKKGDDVGIKIRDKAKQNDIIYRI